MMIIRPIQAKDHDALWELAEKTGAGFTSLQPDTERVASKLNWALNSQKNPSNHADDPKENLYLFVMEDTDTQQVVGTTAIESAVGLTAPWYNYKVNKQVHASDKLGVYNIAETLMLSNDHTGYSELCTLFLSPEARQPGNGALLSRSRFLFVAAFPALFSDILIAEMRGYCDEHEVSPFWEAVGRHFFSVDFVDADRHVAADKATIAQLMPRHPIYANLLPDEAQRVIAQTHASTTPARRLLEAEGFHYTGYVDIFDAGPLLESRIHDIRAVRDSRRYKININNAPAVDDRQWLLANDRFADFRCIMGNLSFEGFESINIIAEQAQALNVNDGDEIRVVPLSASRNILR